MNATPATKGARPKGQRRKGHDNPEKKIRGVMSGYHPKVPAESQEIQPVEPNPGMVYSQFDSAIGVWLIKSLHLPIFTTVYIIMTTLLTEIQKTIATATQADVDAILKVFSNQSEAGILGNHGKFKAFRDKVAGLQSSLVAKAEGIAPKIEVQPIAALQSGIDEIVVADRAKEAAFDRAMAALEIPIEPTKGIDQKAALQAQIKALKEQAEIDELEEQLLELKAQQAQKAREITALRETVLDSEEALVGQRAAIEFREKNSEAVLELAKSVGITGSQGQFDKTIAALNRSLEIVTDTPVEAQIALGEMGERRAAMKNRIMLIENRTQPEVPRMAMCGATEPVMKTVTIDA